MLLRGEGDLAAGLCPVVFELSGMKVTMEMQQREDAGRVRWAGEEKLEEEHIFCGRYLKERGVEPGEKYGLADSGDRVEASVRSALLRIFARKQGAFTFEGLEGAIDLAEMDMPEVGGGLVNELLQGVTRQGLITQDSEEEVFDHLMGTLQT